MRQADAQRFVRKASRRDRTAAARRPDAHDLVARDTNDASDIFALADAVLRDTLLADYFE